MFAALPVLLLSAGSTTSLRGQPIHAFHAPTSWSYENNPKLGMAGPERWHLLDGATACQSSAAFASEQSPIDIQAAFTIEAQWLPTLKLGGGYSKLAGSKQRMFGDGNAPVWVNNGHTLELGPNHLAGDAETGKGERQLSSGHVEVDEVSASSVTKAQEGLLSGTTQIEGHLQAQQQFANPDVGSIDIGGLSRLNFQGPTLATNMTDEGWDEGESEYELLQLHLHWGRNNAEGSEHLVGGKSHPLEIHLVHTQRGNPYPTKSPGGLVVVGVMFEVDDEKPNPSLQHLVDKINAGKMMKPGSSTFVSPDFDVRTLLPKGFERNYLTYRGSLTTPGCFQSVNWIIAGETLSVSSDQLKALRSVESLAPGVPLTHNFRPAQPRNGRVVWMKGDSAYAKVTAVGASGEKVQPTAAPGAGYTLSAYDGSV